MKNLLFASAIIGSLFSCSLDKGVEMENLSEKSNTELYPQKWELVEMSGSFTGIPPSTGSDMEWQEYYLLYEDNTFVKSRTQDQVTTEESGTYAFVTLSDGEYLVLSYASDNELIGNCTSEPKELLKLEAEDKLVGTWWACDGPGLFYEKAE